MAKESFLFVPYHVGQKDVADVKLANSDARSHAAAVSRQRRDNKRLKAQLNLQSLATIGLDTGRTHATQEQDSPAHDPSNSDSSSETSPANQNQRGKMNAQRRQQMRAMQFSWRAGSITNDFKLGHEPRTDPQSLLTDPSFANAAKNYFWQVISPMNRPIYAIFNVTDIYASYWNELMADDDYEPVGVAMAGAIMQKMAQPEKAPSNEVRVNQASAVASLQRKYREASLSGCATMDDIAILIVLALANLARLFGDLRAYESHRAMLKDMVQTRGGLDALGHGGLAKSVIMQWDSFWVFETNGVPIFPDSHTEQSLVYPAFPLCGDLREIFFKLPAGFQSLVMKGKISVETIHILGRVVEASTSDPSVQGAEVLHNHDRRYNDFIEACPCLSISDSARTTIEKELCLAVLLYCTNAFTNTRSPISLYCSSRTELTRLLMRLDENKYSAPEQECLYWVCLVCIDSYRASNSETLLPSKAHCLLPIMRRLQHNHAVNNSIQKFFFNENLLHACERYIELTG